MQKKQRFEDIERIRQIQKTSIEMLTVMHRGLSAISQGELTETGALAMKRLAGQTLDEVRNIALDLDGGDALPGSASAETPKG